MSRQINLYDPALRRQRDWLALGNVALVGGLLAGVVAVAGYAARSELPALSTQVAANEVQLKTLREQVTALGQQAANRKPDPALAREIEATRLLLAARGEVLALLKKDLGPGATSYAEFLRGFARQSVPGLWLTGFALETAGGLEIRGRTVDPALLPEYILRLNREPAFQGRAFAALNLAEGKADAPAPGAAAPAGKKPPFHEFRLIPRKPLGEGGKDALLTQGQAGGGPG